MSVLIAYVLVAVAWIGCGVLGAFGAAQQPRDRTAASVTAGTSVLSGVVVTEEASPRPLRRAIVTLSSAALPGDRRVATNDDGHFAFPGLPAGRYTVTAEKPAYVKSYYGSTRVGRGPAAPIALGGGQTIATLTLALMRGAVVEGTVRDENGVAVSSAQVRVLQPVIVHGERRLLGPPGPVQLATTDDRGRYRIYGLPPGEYTVRSTGGGSVPGGVRLTTAAQVSAARQALAGGDAGAIDEGPQVARSGSYYPGVADAARAEFVTLGPGEERTGVDLTSALVRASRVEGIAVGPAGEPLQNIMVGIANVSAGRLWTSPGAVRPGPDGRFTLRSMTPGRYLIFGGGNLGQARSAAGERLRLWTSTEIIVDQQDVLNVVLPFAPGTDVAGRLVFDGASAAPDPATIELSLDPAPTIARAAVSQPPVSPQPDGRFVFPAVAPGKYHLTMTGGGTWTLRSAIVNGRDVLDLPLDVPSGMRVPEIAVTLADRRTELSGTLFDQLDRPSPDYAIVVFSTNRELWGAPRRHSGVVKLDSNGRFSVIGLPAGEYFITALVDADPAQLAEPAFLEYLATTSIKVVLAEGEQKVQDFKLSGGRH